MATRHWVEMAAMMVIGEGVIGVAHPERYLRLWRVGPKPLRTLVDAAARHPSAMRFVFAAQIAAGYWIARRQLEGEPDKLKGR
jgi:hypothetical protein